MQPLQDIQRDVQGLIDRVNMSLELSPIIAKGDEEEWQVDQGITVSEELGLCGSLVYNNCTRHFALAWKFQKFSFKIAPWSPIHETMAEV